MSFRERPRDGVSLRRDRSPATSPNTDKKEERGRDPRTDYSPPPAAGDLSRRRQAVADRIVAEKGERTANARAEQAERNADEYLSRLTASIAEAKALHAKIAILTQDLANTRASLREVSEKAQRDATNTYCDYKKDIQAQTDARKHAEKELPTLKARIMHLEGVAGLSEARARKAEEKAIEAISRANSEQVARLEAMQCVTQAQARLYQQSATIETLQAQIHETGSVVAPRSAPTHNRYSYSIRQQPALFFSGPAASGPPTAPPAPGQPEFSSPGGPG